MRKGYLYLFIASVCFGTLVIPVRVLMQTGRFAVLDRISFPGGQSLFFVWCRMGVGATIMLGYTLLLRGAKELRPRQIKWTLCLCACQAITTISYFAALAMTQAYRAAFVLYTCGIITALLEVILRKERLRGGTALAVVFVVAGLGVILLGSADQLLAYGLGLVSAISYGIAGYVGKTLKDEGVTGYYRGVVSVGMVALLLTVFPVGSWWAHHGAELGRAVWTPSALFWLAVLGLVGAGFPFLLQTLGQDALEDNQHMFLAMSAEPLVASLAGHYWGDHADPHWAMTLTGCFLVAFAVACVNIRWLDAAGDRLLASLGLARTATVRRGEEAIGG